MRMELMAGEQVLLESDTKELVLTTHRVRLDAPRFGSGYTASIMLEQLASCEIRQSSHPMLLAAAVLALLFGVSAQDRGNNAAIIGVLVAVILGIAYLATRRHVVTLRSAGASIDAVTSGMSADAVTGFVNAVESAKNGRYLLSAATALSR